MNNLFIAFEDNFGQCETTIQHINKLTSNIYSNFDYLKKLIGLIVHNKKIVDKGKTKMISDIIGCLRNKFKYYWQAISDQISEAGQSEKEPFLKEMYLRSLHDYLSEIVPFNIGGKIPEDLETHSKRYTVYEEEIMNILKEIKDTNNDKTLTIVATCLVTITILVGGFLLYRYIKSKNNSNQIKNTKDFVIS